MPRIVSFLPAATEMVCALGLSDQLVGITHECDYPPEIAGKPVVVRSAVHTDHLSQPAIDAAVRERLRSGASLYEVDEPLLRELAPDLILTQNLCQACAPSGNTVAQALHLLPKPPEILYLTPRALGDIFENLSTVARATGTAVQAAPLISAAQARLAIVEQRSALLPARPRVLFLEWLDPVYCGGHWVPEMIELAGGRDALGRKGADSVRVTWAEVCAYQPEVLLLAPCGYSLRGVLELAPQLVALPGWSLLPAVNQNRVFAVDANSYFARPGPRVVEGVELLAHLIHPGDDAWGGPHNAYAHIRTGEPATEVSTTECGPGNRQ